MLFNAIFVAIYFVGEPPACAEASAGREVKHL